METIEEVAAVNNGKMRLAAYYGRKYGKQRESPAPAGSNVRQDSLLCLSKTVLLSFPDLRVA